MVESLVEIEKDLIGEAWTSRHIYANLEALCDFGSRFGGTPGEAQAREFLQARFAEYGLQKVHLEGFGYTSWARGRCDVQVIQPVVRDLNAIALVYSPSTPAGGLQRRVVDVGSGTEAEFEAQRHAIADQFVLTTSASPAGGPWIHRREKYGRAVEAGAAGFIFMNHLPGLLPPTGSLRPGRLGEIPAIGLSHEEGFNLQRWSGRGDVVVEMVLENGVRPAEAFHVVGEVPGAPGGQVIIIGAHYDGHDISQGAMDDGAGTALLLELARLFAPLAGQLRHSLRFIAFAVEELGVLGSTEYVRQHAQESADWALMVNLDPGVGPGPHGFDLNGFTELQPILSTCAREMGHPLTLTDRIATAADNFPFVMAGVPAINLQGKQRDLGLGRGYGHTAADTLDKVQEIDLKASAAVMARVLLRLATYPGALGRHRTRSEVRQMLVDHGLERALRAQDKWPF